MEVRDPHTHHPAAGGRQLHWLHYADPGVAPICRSCFGSIGAIVNSRFHMSPRTVQKAVKRAVRSAGIPKHATCHTLRHSFATHLLAGGYDIRTLQELLGHRSVTTTMIYTHVLNRSGRGVQSPADALDL